MIRMPDKPGPWARLAAHIRPGPGKAGTPMQLKTNTITNGG